MIHSHFELEEKLIESIFKYGNQCNYFIQFKCSVITKLP